MPTGDFHGDRRTKTITLHMGVKEYHKVTLPHAWGVSHVFMEHLQKTLELVLMGCPTFIFVQQSVNATVNHAYTYILNLGTLQ